MCAAESNSQGKPYRLSWATSGKNLYFDVAWGLQTHYKWAQDTSLLLLRGIMKLCLSFKRLQVNNNINPTNLLLKAEPAGTEQYYYWWTLIMCCTWQTHLGLRKTFTKSSNRNLKIHQLLSSLAQGLQELDHRVFVGQGIWVSMLWFGDWKNTFVMWIFELLDVSSLWLII